MLNMYNVFLDSGNGTTGTKQTSTWVGVLQDFINNYKLPISIILLIAGAFMAIFISVAMAKEEDSGKALVLRKRLYGLIGTVILVIALLWLLDFVLGRIPNIKEGIGDIVNS